MSENKVVYSVSLKDQLTSGLEHANRRGQALNTTMAGIGSTIAGLGIAYAASSFLKDSVKQWNESEQSLAQLNATLKSTGGAVGLSSDALQAQAKALQNITTYDDDAVIGMQSLLTTFTQIKGAVFTEAVPAIVDLSAKMGTDLKGSAIQVGKALQDPIRGLTALQRGGIMFSDSQRALIKTLVGTNDIAGAQRVILAELTKEVGGSAEAMGKAGLGPITMMHNKLNDVKEEIGGLVAKIVIGLVPTIDKMVKGLGIAVQWINDNQKAFVGLVTGISAMVVALKIAIPVMQGFGTSAMGMLGPLGLIITTIGVATGAYMLYADAVERASRVQKDNADRAKTQTMKDLQEVSTMYVKNGMTEAAAKKKASSIAMETLEGDLQRANDDLERAQDRQKTLRELGYSSQADELNKAISDKKYLIEQFEAQKAGVKEFSNTGLVSKGSALTNASQTTKSPKVSTRSQAQGTKVTTINMSIRELIHEFNINTTNVKEGAYKVSEMITNAITGALNDSQLIVE